MRHGIDQLKWFIGTYILMRKGLRRPVFLRKDEPEVVYVTHTEGFGDDLELSNRSFDPVPHNRFEGRY